MSRRLWGCATLAWLVVVGVAMADPPPSDRPQIESVEFPFGSPLSADRWCPVIVRVSSGATPVQGVLTLSYAQDGSQDVAIAVRVATTPGKSVPVEMAVALPRQATELIVNFQSERGRSLDERRLVLGGPAGRTLFKPSESLVRVLEVGDESLLAAFRQDRKYAARENAIAMGAETGGAGGQVGEAAVESLPTLADSVAIDAVRNVGDLPHAWLSYEGVDVVVARATVLAGADARAKAALIEWVGAGGRLVVIADGPGPEWKQYVPGWEGLLKVGEIETLTPGEAMTRATLDAPRQKVTRNNPQPGGVERQVKPAEKDTRATPTATSFGMRRISLSKDARGEGWSVGWGVSEDADTSSGLVARGPVGMGVVTLVGVDFSRVMVTDPAGGARNLWLAMLGDARLGPLPTHILRRVGEANDYPWQYSGWNSGCDEFARAAIVGSINLVTSDPAIGDGLMYGIGGCALLLAIGVGPWERFRARRRASSRWHVTRALAWIGVMSVAGGLVPQVMRNGGSQRRCAEAVDVLAPVGTEWRSGVVSSFSGKPETIDLPDRGSAWQRGVSEGFDYWNAKRRAIFSPLQSILVLGDGAHDAGAMVLAPPQQPQWTVRTFMYQTMARGIDPALPTVGLTRIKSGWAMEIRGIPKDARLANVQVALRTGVRPVQLSRDNSPDSDGAFRGELYDSHEAKALAWDGRWQAEWVHTGQWWQHQGNEYGNPLIALPGARNRDDAIAARVIGGGYACVAMQIDNPEDGYSRPGGGRQALRVLVPLPEETRHD